MSQDTTFEQALAPARQRPGVAIEAAPAFDDTASLGLSPDRAHLTQRWELDANLWTWREPPVASADMALRDHKKGWEFHISATPEACERAFRSVFSTKLPFYARARSSWTISEENDSDNGVHLVAHLVDVHAARAAMQQEIRAAIGGQIGFRIRGNESRTTCELWLKDAPRVRVAGIPKIAAPEIYRKYFGLVRKAMREVDPNLEELSG